VVVDQRGIDIALNLFAPDGRQLGNVDDRHGERGLEAASVVASTPGSIGLRFVRNGKLITRQLSAEERKCVWQPGRTVP
jgi:hypothetical protein